MCWIQLASCDDTLSNLYSEDKIRKYVSRSLGGSEMSGHKCVQTV